MYVTSSCGIQCHVRHTIESSAAFANAQRFSTILAVDYGYANEIIKQGGVYYVVEPAKAIAIGFK